MTAPALDDHTLTRLTRHVAIEEIPPDEDLFAAADLEAAITRAAEPPLDLLVGGDIMLGGRARRLLESHGRDYPFAGVRPLLARATTVLANLEGPLARHADRQERRYSYRVAPGTARALGRAGITLVTLANNHLMDCGRDGVLETLEVLALAGIGVVGAGVDRAAAHRPVVFSAPGGSVGVLGYYWNRRCAARAKLPGSAMDDDASLARDIPALRERVDLLVVTSHWGVPYDREPADAERARARHAIDLGADAVIAHHPHVIQPIEIYRGRPIFYSVGNFAFGSGNSKAEGLLVGLRREGPDLVVEAHPLYVKNRDPRVSYQPKLLRGSSVRRIIDALVARSRLSGAEVARDGGRLTLRLPWNRS